MIHGLNHFVYAFISTIGFALLFNAPKNALLKSGLGGGLGWLTYILVNQISGSTVASTFIAALVIATTGEIFAIIGRKPITVFIIPGIIPLVPGYGLYYMMLSIIEGDSAKALTYGSDALLVAIAIAGALTIVLSLNSYRKQKQTRRSLV
ncbi:membrane spanning protein [Alkaliphilus metalliredigens QYMF]|uniref:Membrane spanning protein n=1 Tax=Alkaliphilus metalliredigens (strain QYMF) TaxID=293826 RepID=A6TQP9_ALKMQ|nr:threonine/serine exporter family protein [Alkaliphilus metalliredigens]ABR48517.1 membrane spanning protein [Alkaliphilus metalliredigens QYMF]